MAREHLGVGERAVLRRGEQRVVGRSVPDHVRQVLGELEGRQGGDVGVVLGPELGAKERLGRQQHGDQRAGEGITRPLLAHEVGEQVEVGLGRRCVGPVGPEQERPEVLGQARLVETVECARQVGRDRVEVVADEREQVFLQRGEEDVVHAGAVGVVDEVLHPAGDRDPRERHVDPEGNRDRTLVLTGRQPPHASIVALRGGGVVVIVVVAVIVIVVAIILAVVRTCGIERRRGIDRQTGVTGTRRERRDERELPLQFELNR